MATAGAGQIENGFLRLVASGVVGAVASEAMGGDFRSGFLSGLAAAAMAPSVGSMTRQNWLAGLVLSSVVGGTASAIGGGKYANGAAFAAFYYVLNTPIPKRSQSSVSNAPNSESAQNTSTSSASGTPARYNIVLNGKVIGYVTSDNYSTTSNPGMAGASITLTPVITDASQQSSVYQWKQNFSIQDQDGNYQQWHGLTANSLLDPQPPDDNKDWYYTDPEFRADPNTSGLDS